MSKAQSILYQLLGGLTSVKRFMKSFKLQAQGNISQGQQPARPLKSCRLLQMEWVKQPLSYVPGEVTERQIERRQIGPLAKAESVSQNSIKRQLQFL